MRGRGSVAADGFERGYDAERTVEPAAIGNRVHVTGDHDGFVRSTGKRGEEVSGGIDFMGQADGRKFFEEPFACGAPDGAPSKALRAIGRRSKCGEFAKRSEERRVGKEGRS